uniref:BTB domain-containing protein n=1 Tax=Syphacia muris TaxID=451379 RepID=A0A0N5ALV0_9BILA
MIVSDIRKLKLFGRSRTRIALLPLEKKNSETDSEVFQYIKPFKARSSSVASCSSRSSRSEKLLGKCCSINIRPTSSESSESVTVFVKPRNTSLDGEKIESVVEYTKQLNLESPGSSLVFLDESKEKKPLYYRVLEFLFCGPFETANNQQIMTSFGISYILAMLNKFHIINHFIAEARSRGANVILCNRDGENVCQAIALQYIMYYHKIPLKNALNYIENVEERTTIDLSPRVNLALKAWEVELSEKWNKEKRVFGKRSATSYDGDRAKPRRSSRGSYSRISSSFCSQSKDCGT